MAEVEQFTGSVSIPVHRLWSISGTYNSDTSSYSNFARRGIGIDVGIDAQQVNAQLRWFHDRLDQNNIDHDYHEYAGEHNWTFWSKWTPKQFGVLQDYITS